MYYNNLNMHVLITKQIQKSFKKSNWAFIVIAASLLLIGISMRTLYPGNYPFGFDQVQILENAKKILQGNLTLIGPRTGPATLFTGPLIYYATALFMPFFGEPYSVVVASLSFSIITGLFALILSIHYFKDRLLSLSVTAIWSLSPFMIQMDRISWNPNISMLAGLLVSFPIFARLLNNKPLRLGDALIVGLGVFLGYQAHFSGLILISYALFGWWLLPAKKFYAAIIVFVSFMLSLMPTILFDIRHNFLNITGLLALFQDDSKVSLHDFGSTAVNNFFTVFHLTGRLLWEHNNPLFVGLTGVFVFLFVIAYKLWSVKLRVYILSWIVGMPFVFVFYKSNIPEYYYLILVPTLLFLLSFIGKIVFENQNMKLKMSFFVLLAAYLTAVSLTKSIAPSFTSIKEVRETTSYAKGMLENNANLTVVFDMEPIDSLGYKYLMRDYIDRFAYSHTLLHMIHPASPNAFSDYQSGKAAVWEDLRTDANANHYLADSEYIIKTPRNLKLYKDISGYEGFPQADSLAVIMDGKEQAYLLILPIAASEPSAPEQEIITACSQGKQLTSNNQKLKCSQHYALWLEPSNYNEAAIIDLSNISLIKEMGLDN